MLLLMNSGFYFELLTKEALHFIMLVIFFATCVLPLLSLSALMLNPKFDRNMSRSTDRIFPLLITAVFYYFGFILLRKVPIFPIIRLFLLAGILVIIASLLISIKWKISLHMASLGSLSGLFFALSFRNGINPVYSLLLIIIVSGLVGTARLLLHKNNIGQILAGFLVGFVIFYGLIYFV